MAFTANVFTPTAIGTKIIAESALLTSGRMAELSQEIIAGQAIMMHQDPFFITDGFGESCYNIKTSTLRSASLDTGDKVIDCKPASGVKAGSETLALDKAILTNAEEFQIDDILCANSVTFGEQLAYLGAKAKVAIEVKLSKALVALAATGQDTPLASWFETAGAVVGTAYEIEADNFTSDVIADVQWAAKYADMFNPIIINGRNFYNKHILEMYASQGCCTNDAILNRNQAFDLYWDAKNVDSVLGADSTIVIDKNSILFMSSPVYSNIGIENMVEMDNDTYVWVEMLPRLQYFAGGKMNPVYVNVRAAKTCVKDALGTPRTSWAIQYWTTGAMRLNLPNEIGDYGILRINKVANA